MRSPRHARRAPPGLAALAALVLPCGTLALAWPLWAAPAPTAGDLPTEARAELVRARREQALIRAEGTAAMLRRLDAVTAIAEGGQ